MEDIRGSHPIDHVCLSSNPTFANASCKCGKRALYHYSDGIPDEKIPVCRDCAKELALALAFQR